MRRKHVKWGQRGRTRYASAAGLSGSQDRLESGGPEGGGDTLCRGSVEVAPDLHPVPRSLAGLHERHGVAARTQLLDKLFSVLPNIERTGLHMTPGRCLRARGGRRSFRGRWRNRRLGLAPSRSGRRRDWRFPPQLCTEFREARTLVETNPVLRLRSSTPRSFSLAHRPMRGGFLRATIIERMRSRVRLPVPVHEPLMLAAVFESALLAMSTAMRRLAHGSAAMWTLTADGNHASVLSESDFPQSSRDFSPMASRRSQSRAGMAGTGSGGR